MYICITYVYTYTDYIYFGLLSVSCVPVIMGQKRVWIESLFFNNRS